MTMRDVATMAGTGQAAKNGVPVAVQAALLLLAALAMSACGGGGGGGNGFAGNPGGGSGGSGGNSFQPGVFMPASTFEARCAAPRGPNAPNGPWPDVQGTTVDENNFLRSYSNDTYLWYDEITDRDPALFDTAAYFDLLVTEELTPSGNFKDNFHFTVETNEWIALSQSGTSSGYGAQFAILQPNPSDPPQIYVAFTEPNSPATGAGVDLSRGAQVLTVDGVSIDNIASQADADIVNAGLFPSDDGETHMFTVLDLGAQASRDISITSATITSTPVQNVTTIPTATGDVGYLLFNDHIATAEQGLVDAVNQLDAADVSDLVVDLRYNGGGFLALASEFAYMVAGSGPTAGRTFELLQFNDKHPTTNPITGQAISPVPFYDVAQGFSVTSGTALPTLDLPRVFVLTGAGTCSASEAIINGLRGANVEVIQIGSTTCGKPYGFYPTDNCGITYFTIQFRGVNDQNFGDYSDGFSPANTAGTAGVALPGCSVADDFSAGLGDPAEARLAAALAYRDSGTCPAPSGIDRPGVAAAQVGVDSALTIPKSVWRQNRILRR